MRRKLLLILFPFAAILVVLSSLMVIHPQSVTSTMMPGMMTRMMGESISTMPLLWPSVLTISGVAIFIGLAYLIAFPTIKYSEDAPAVVTVPTSVETLDPLSMLIRVSKPDERAVLEVLRGSGGVCRQRDIVFKTGLSKLKVHRIIARFAERGAIQVKKMGKTNEVTVPSWLMPSQLDPHKV